MSRTQVTRWAIFTGVLVLGAVPLVAQERERVRVQGVGPNQMTMYMTRRARLGVNVSLQPRPSDSVGAYLEAVTPGGPAEKAGLQGGDIVTKLGATSLAGAGDGDRSLPGMKLVELAAKLGPNDTVKVEYRRGTDKRTTSLVTQGDRDNVYTIMPDGQGPMRDFAFRFGDGNWEEFQRSHPDMKVQIERFGPEMGGMGPMRMSWSSELEDLELVALNPDLGSYFGASDGVLVIRVPKDSPLGLKGGDVVVTVDGRKVTSTSQLHRILRTYESDEPIKFEILRNKKKDTVNGKAPSRPDGKCKTQKVGGVMMKQKSGAGA